MRVGDGAPEGLPGPAPSFCIINAPTPPTPPIPSRKSVRNSSAVPAVLRKMGIKSPGRILAVPEQRCAPS